MGLWNKTRAAGRARVGLCLSVGLLAFVGAQAATEYRYDELNRLTRVVYDDGRSISYSYDAAGNLLRKVNAGPLLNPDVQLEDRFDGSALDPTIWNTYGGTSCGGSVVTGGSVRFNGGTYADTVGKKGFAGDKIVVEAVMAGLGSQRDTHFELIDTVTRDRIQFGDTTYSGGLYAYGTGRYEYPQGLLQATTNTFKAYRLTVEGNQIKVERGDTFDGPMFSRTITLPSSTAGRSFYVRIGTGGNDCYYSPGTFESIKVTVASRLVNASADNFDAAALDATRWISAGYTFEPSANGTGPVGPVTLGGGAMEFGNGGGVATLGKQHFKGRKIVVEARVARTGNGEFPIMLVNVANISDRVLISETPYIGAGFLGGGGGRFKVVPGTGDACAAAEQAIILGSPAAAGTWMEYRMTMEGNRFTMERGPTLANITQSATGTMCTSIEPYELFLYMRTGGLGSFFGARFDWVRVNVIP